MPARSDVPAGVAEAGFVWLRDPLEYIESVEFVGQLGEILDVTAVRLRPDVDTYLCQPEAMAVHTDPPSAKLIAWYCHAQDELDGASLLVDSVKVLAELPAGDREVLRGVRMKHRGFSQAVPVLGEHGEFFFAPWLEPVGADERSFEVMTRLRAALAAAQGSATEVRLAPGQLLVVDNHRTLHGRRALQPGSRRHLERYWVG